MVFFAPIAPGSSPPCPGSTTMMILSFPAEPADAFELVFAGAFALAFALAAGLAAEFFEGFFEPFCEASAEALFAAT